MSNYKFTVQVDMSEGDIFKSIDLETARRISQTEDYHEALGFLLENSIDTCIWSTEEIDLYFSFHEHQWGSLREEWKEITGL